MCREVERWTQSIFFFRREVDFGLHVLEFLSSVVWKVVTVFWFIFYPNTLGKKSKQVPVPYSTCTGKENRKRQKVSSAQKERDLNILSQHDELVRSDLLGPNPPTNNAHSTRTLAHPHFGGKQPKQHQPPQCTSVVCREEKKILEDHLRDARQEVERVQMELEEVQAELSESKFMIGLPILLMFVKTVTITKTGIVINV